MKVLESFLLFSILEKEGVGMTMNEASEQYKIPPEILREYEKLGLCGAVKKIMGAWQYDDSDLKNLSLIMTLHHTGFTPEEIEDYMRLMLEENATQEERLRILDRKRADALDEIHFHEQQLECLDYLRHKIRCKTQENLSALNGEPSSGTA